MRTFTLAVVFGAISGVLALHGCGIDVTGYADQAEAGVTPRGDADTAAETGTSSGTGEGGALTDAPSFSDAPAETGPACSCPDAPTGWELVAYADDRSAGCGAGLRTDERVTAPNAGGDSCSCDCQITASPSCNKGIFTSVKDSNGPSGPAQCNDPGTDHDAADGACQKENKTLVDHRRAVPPPPSGAGSCAAPGIQHPEKVTSTPVRVCAAATAGACVCDQPSPFRTCVRQAGDRTCPTGYTKKLSVGTAAGVTCGACGCTTKFTCSGTINYYNDDKCQSLAEAIDDQSCQKETANSFNSFKWVGKVNSTCTSQGASAPTPALADTETICCL